MIRTTKTGAVKDGKTYKELAGLHDDEKPTTGLLTGSLYLEVDTGDVYAFAEGETPEWHKIAALGGGA